MNECMKEEEEEEEEACHKHKHRHTRTHARREEIRNTQHTAHAVAIKRQTIEDVKAA